MKISPWSLIGLAAVACSHPPRTVTAPVARPASRDIAATVMLLGDAGEPDADGEPVLGAAAREIGDNGARTVVVFLGDNIYPGGMPGPAEPDRQDAERRLNAQIALVREAGARGVFVPGNHDWDNGGQQGWERIRYQGEYIGHAGDQRISFLPAGGCPGPSVVDLDPGPRLILLDTQWWLHNGPRPDRPDQGCAAHTEGGVIDSLRVALRGAGPRPVIVMAHHPLVSGGPHSGHFDWTDHIFPLHRLVHWLWLPLPVIGSLYPLVRGAGVSPQDMSNHRNARMRHALERVLEEYPPLVYASGHDHNLQVFRGTNARFLLVSGGGFYGSPYPVVEKGATLFASPQKGFMRLDLLSDGRVRLGVIGVRGKDLAAEEYSLWLTEREATAEK